MPEPLTRRSFLKQAAFVPVLAGSAASYIAARRLEEPLFKISLAEWSLNRPLFAKKMDHLDFARTARSLNIDGVEYVNQFFMDKAKDMAYLREMKTRAEGEGVTSVLIMCDLEGRLGDPDAAKRLEAAEKHYKWVDAARFLGCHAIRVNGYSEGTFEEQQDRVADGFRRLVEYGAGQDIYVIIENHGGFSSNAKWVEGLVRKVDHPRFGTLPDFGNFRIDASTTYDSYQGVAEMMPFAKGVSVKPQGFDAAGKSIEIDLERMMGIVLKAGYHGFAGIEHGGEKDQELQAIAELRDKLVQVRGRLSQG